MAEGEAIQKKRMETAMCSGRSATFIRCTKVYHNDVNMKKQPLEGELLEDSHIFLHPVRYRIMELLAEQPMHINAISTSMRMERRLVSYHLGTLEDKGFVTSKYEISETGKSRGKALRMSTASDKMAEVKAKLKKEL